MPRRLLEEAMAPPPPAPPQLAAVVAALKRRYHPERIVLFGSYAWGTPRDDSDVDLLVIKDSRATFFERCAEVRRLVRAERRGMPLDLLVCTPEEIDARLAAGDPLITDIVRRGVVLHAA
jgi:predicted nucleotidyltransferase